MAGRLGKIRLQRVALGVVIAGGLGAVALHLDGQVTSGAKPPPKMVARRNIGGDGGGCGLGADGVACGMMEDHPGPVWVVGDLDVQGINRRSHDESAARWRLSSRIDLQRRAVLSFSHGATRG